MESATRSAESAAMEPAPAEPTTMEAAPVEPAAMEASAVEATTASAVEATATASAGETVRGRRERKGEADNLTEYCCFHGEH